MSIARRALGDAISLGHRCDRGLFLPPATLRGGGLSEEFNRSSLDGDENLSERRLLPDFFERTRLVENEAWADELEIRLRLDPQQRQPGAVVVAEIAAIDRRHTRRQHVTERRHIAAVGEISCRQRQLPARKPRHRFLTSVARSRPQLLQLLLRGGWLSARHWRSPVQEKLDGFPHVDRPRMLVGRHVGRSRDAETLVFRRRQSSREVDEALLEL